MTQIKHTPGPWRVARGTNEVLTGTPSKGKAICVASLWEPVATKNTPQLEERLATMRANAQLIPAAPDLLDVVRRYAEIMGSRSFKGGLDPMVCEELNFLKVLANDALAKARWEAKP